MIYQCLTFNFGRVVRVFMPNFETKLKCPVFIEALQNTTIIEDQPTRPHPVDQYKASDQVISSINVGHNKYYISNKYMYSTNLWLTVLG